MSIVFDSGFQPQKPQAQPTRSQNSPLFLEILSGKVGTHNQGAMVQAAEEMHKEELRIRKDAIEQGEGLGPYEESLMELLNDLKKCILTIKKLEDDLKR